MPDRWLFASLGVSSLDLGRLCRDQRLAKRDGSSGPFSWMNKPESFGIVPVPVLTNENHERYARLRAILVPPRGAVKAIGLKVTSGVATKLEKNKAIRERIAELVGDEVEVLREKRQQIEGALSAIAYGDGSEFPGKRMPLDWFNRLGAINQLRDMHGFKSVNKTALTDPTGTQPASVYLISERPMSESEWEAQRASAPA